MANPEKSSYAIPAEDVLPDNSNLWRHNRALAEELKKLRFKKAKPEVYNLFCAAAGIDGAINPTEAIDLQMDIDKFAESIEDPRDKIIFRAFLLGRIKQVELAELLDCCQATISNRLRRLIQGFKEFYLESD